MRNARKHMLPGGLRLALFIALLLGPASGIVPVPGGAPVQPAAAAGRAPN